MTVTTGGLVRNHEAENLLLMKQEVLERQLDESGQRGQDRTYQKMKLLYYWNGLYRDIDQYIQSYSDC